MLNFNLADGHFTLTPSSSVPNSYPYHSTTTTTPAATSMPISCHQPTTYTTNDNVKSSWNSIHGPTSELATVNGECIGQTVGYLESKDSENVKRFSVNNLLQLAGDCCSADRLAGLCFFIKFEWYQTDVISIHFDLHFLWDSRMNRTKNVSNWIKSEFLIEKSKAKIFGWNLCEKANNRSIHFHLISVKFFVHGNESNECFQRCVLKESVQSLVDMCVDLSTFKC